MEVTADVNDRHWLNAVDLLTDLYAQKAYEASYQAAEAIQELTRAKLLALKHEAHTKTPSLPGEPPAAISGRLAASVSVEGEPGELGAKVGPTSEASSKNGPYGRAQELSHLSKGHPFMKWQEDGVWHEVRKRFLPKRPYLKPATDEMIESGRITRIYVLRWTEAQYEAAAG